MTYISKIAIHTSKDGIVAGAGMRGVDEDLDGGDGVVMVAQQAAVMVTAMRVVIWIKRPLPVQRTVRLRQLCAVAVGPPLRAQAIRLRHHRLRVMQCTR